MEKSQVLSTSKIAVLSKEISASNGRKQYRIRLVYWSNLTDEDWRRLRSTLNPHDTWPSAYRLFKNRRAAQQAYLWLQLAV
jgi:hypothetical protein